VALLPEVEAVRSALRALAAVDWRGVSSAQMMEAAEEIFGAEAVLRAVQVAMLAELEATDGTVAECGRPVRSWLIEEHQLNPADASRRVRLARRLPFAPATREALATGAIGPDQALVIAEVLPEITDPDTRELAEKELLELAEFTPPNELARFVDEMKVRLELDRSSDDAYNRRYGQRNLTIAETFGGTGSLAGTLTPELREKLQLALNVVGDKAGPEDDRTHAQRRHDGLGEIVDHFLATADLPAVNGERPRLVLTMDLDALMRDLHDAWVTMPSGAKICPAVARRLACDAEVIPAVLGANSEVLDLGRASRTFSTAIRRAAHLRDGGRCAYPGCRRRVVDCHHIVWWSAGGKTTLDNAAWLCAFHHWLVHEGGWTLRRNTDGGYTWTSPTGVNKTGPPPRHPQAA
jgi:hypothetical protein